MTIKFIIVCIPFPKKPVTECLEYNSLENNVEQGEIAWNKYFLLSHSVFNLWTILIKIEILICKHFIEKSKICYLGKAYASYNLYFAQYSLETKLENVKSCSSFPHYLARLWALGNLQIESLFVVCKIR